MIMYDKYENKLSKEKNIKTIFIFKLGQLGNKIENKAVSTVLKIHHRLIIHMHITYYMFLKYTLNFFNLISSLILHV